MRFNTRQLVLLAVFGTLWGVVEIGLGAVLKSLDIPLSGAVLAALGLLVALTGRVFVPVRGSTLFIGVIAMLLKMFSLGGVIIGPMIGIFSEALIAEVILSIASRPSRPIFLLAGGLGVLWTLVQPFFTGLLLFGRGPFVIWLDLLDQGARLFSINASAALWIVAVMAGVHLLIGGISGWLAWDISRQLRVRLQGNQLQSINNGTR